LPRLPQSPGAAPCTCHCRPFAKHRVNNLATAAAPHNSNNSKLNQSRPTPIFSLVINGSQPVTTSTPKPTAKPEHSVSSLKRSEHEDGGEEQGTATSQQHTQGCIKAMQRVRIRSAKEIRRRAQRTLSDAAIEEKRRREKELLSRVRLGHTLRVSNRTSIDRFTHSKALPYHWSPTCAATAVKKKRKTGAAGTNKEWSE